MNSTCSKCGHKFDKPEFGVILCKPCEISWWNSVKLWYSEKIKVLGL